MIPDGATLARRCVQREIAMHRLMDDLVDAGRLDEAAGCRRELADVSLERSALAAVEIRAASVMEDSTLLAAHGTLRR